MKLERQAVARHTIRRAGWALSDGPAGALSATAAPTRAPEPKPPRLLNASADKRGVRTAACRRGAAAATYKMHADSSADDGSHRFARPPQWGFPASTTKWQTAIAAANAATR